MNAQRNLSFGPRKIIAIISLILLLSSSSLVFLGKSDVHALPTRSGHSGGSVPSGIPANAGGFNRGPLQTQGGGPPSGVQPNGGGTSPLTGLRPSTANCAGSNALSPGSITTNCAGSNVAHPTRSPNTAVVQPTNCNIPTTIRHTNTPSTTVVRPNNCPPASSNSLTINNVQTQVPQNRGRMLDYLITYLQNQIRITLRLSLMPDLIKSHIRTPM